MIYQTHCALRLGDNLAALQLVRKLAQANPSGEFVHACNLAYYNQGETLKPVIEDLPNIRLIDIGQVSSDSVDLWKGAGGYFYAHPNRNDYVALMLDFYALCCVRLGLPCPITKREDMLFDYPALKAYGAFYGNFDWLVINSQPHSGQFAGFNYKEFQSIIGALCGKYSVVTTGPVGWPFGQVSAEHLTPTQIGNLSLHCKYILMVSTGVSWPTFNVWAAESVKLRIILLDNERVELTPNTIHRNSIAGAHELLKESGML